MRIIDLNCDMGESFGVYKLGFDEEAMPFITSANIACGFHASDPVNMQKSVRLAQKHGVSIGAHPGFPDLVGFGRREMAMSPAEIMADVIYQIGALGAICQAEGVKMHHVKAHGALYNMAGKDLNCATAIAEAILRVDSNLHMVCLANSCMVEAAKKVGVPYVEEAFADRAYTSEGHLVSRKLPGAVIHDPAIVAERVSRMVLEQTVDSIDGKIVPLNVQTICVHGDSPGAVEMIKAIQSKLIVKGIDCKIY